MSDAPSSFRFFQVSSLQSGKAFDFHASIAASNEHIWPRTNEQVSKYASDGELFGIELSSGLVGLCYCTLEQNGREWELGGLTVRQELQKLHLGSLLVRFGLAHTIAFQQPWANDQEIIAHVHEANSKPRNLLGNIGFEFLESLEIPGHQAPPSMRRNDKGNLSGDKFYFPRSRTASLAKWFEEEADGTLADGRSVANFDYGIVGLDAVKKAINEIAEDYEKER